MGITFVFPFLLRLFSYYKSLENCCPSLTLASLIATLDWSAKCTVFSQLLVKMSKQKNMNCEYQVLSTFPHSCVNVVVWIKKKYIYSSLRFAFKASNLIFGLLCFALPSSIPIMLAFVERPSRSFFFPLGSLNAIDLCITITVPQILTADNAIQDLMAVKVRIECRMIFWLFNLRIVVRLLATLTREWWMRIQHYFMLWKALDAFFKF